MENNTFGPKPSEHEFKIYKDSRRPVRLHISPSGSAMGIIHDYSPGYVYLNPSLSNEGLYNFDGSLQNNAKIETELPHKINIASITNIEPLSEIKYLKDLADSLNSIGKPSSKIIIVKK